VPTKNEFKGWSKHFEYDDEGHKVAVYQRRKMTVFVDRLGTIRNRSTEVIHEKRKKVRVVHGKEEEESRTSVSGP
jgi:hypothetical protein